MTVIGFEFGCATDCGRVRETNADTFVAYVGHVNQTEFIGVFAVIDGMGSEEDGFIAAKITERIIKYMMTNTLRENLSSEGILKAISDALQDAHRALLNLLGAKWRFEGASVVTASVIYKGIIHIAHVGDCAACLITQEQIEQITKDHTLDPSLVECGPLLPETVVLPKRPPILYRALGQTEDLKVDTYTLEIPPDAWLLLRSDGLSRHVTEDEIHKIILAAPNPQAACDQLIALVNERGGEDNTTVIVVRLQSGDESA